MNALVQAEPSLETLLVGEVSRQEAGPMLERLRAARLTDTAGHVDSKLFSERMLYLAGRAAGESVEAPANPFATQQERVDRLTAEAMQGAKPHEYALTYPPLHRLEGDALELDTEVRQALSDMKVPARLGPPIVESIERVAKELGPLSPEDRASRIESFQNELKSKWGDQYKARTDAIVDYVAKATARHEMIGELLDHSPWLLANTAIAEWLWGVVEHQTARK